MIKSKSYKGGISLIIPKNEIQVWLDKYLEDVPESFQQCRFERDGDDYHMTLIASHEHSEVKDKLIDIEENTLYEGYVSDTNFWILGYGKTADSHYIVCHYPAGDLLRKECKLNILCFHITLGFNKTDEHNCQKDMSTLLKPEWDGISNILEHRSPSRVKQLSLLDKIMKMEYYKKIDKYPEFEWWYWYIISWANVQKFDKVDLYLMYLIDLNPHLGYYIDLKIKKLFGKLTEDDIDRAYEGIIDIIIINYSKYKNDIFELLQLMNDNIALDTKTYYINNDEYIISIAAPRNLTKINMNVEQPVLFGSAMVSSSHTDFITGAEFDLIVNLTETSNSIERNIKATYLHSPIVDQESPTMSQCYDVIGQIDMHNKVIVHCIGGKGRTNTIIVAYMIWKMGITLSECIERIKDRHVIITDNQMDFLKKFEHLEIKMKPIRKIHIDDDYNPNIIVLVGLPGSGKSTFAKHLIDSCPHNIKYLNQDEIGRGSFNKSLLQSISKIGDADKLHRIIVVDKCNTNLEERKTIIEYAHKYGGNNPKIWCVWFDISLSDILMRVKTRTDHPTLSAEKTPEVIKEKNESFQIPVLKEGFGKVKHLCDEDDVNELLVSWNLPEMNFYADNYFKFPRTKHIYSLGSAERNDLLMTKDEQNKFLNTEVYAEEKIDGANLGISIDADSMSIKYQNRSHYVLPESYLQFAKLHQWSNVYGTHIYNILEPGRHILFGEWLYSKHSIPYDNLPSYFIAFDMYDKKIGKFYTRTQLEKILSGTNIPVVPLIYKGIFKNKNEVMAKMKLNSKFYNGPIEGLYFKIPDAEDKYIIGRGKVVSNDFLADGTKFWTHNTKPNKLSDITAI